MLNGTQGLVIHCTAKAFYYAQIGFFQSIQGISASAVQDLVDLVEFGVEKLHCTERHARRGEPVRITLWPALVLRLDKADASALLCWKLAKAGNRKFSDSRFFIAAVWVARPNGDIDGPGCRMTTDNFAESCTLRRFRALSPRASAECQLQDAF